MNFQKTKLLMLVTVLLSSLLIMGISLAGPSEGIMDGFSKTGQEAGYDVDKETGAPKKTFTHAWATYTYNFASGAGAAFFFVLAIYSGWLWMTAQGREEQVERAKKLLLGATVGLVIIISAKIIAELIIQYMGVAIDVPANLNTP